MFREVRRKGFCVRTFTFVVEERRTRGSGVATAGRDSPPLVSQRQERIPCLTGLVCTVPCVVLTGITFEPHLSHCCGLEDLVGQERR